MKKLLLILLCPLCSFAVFGQVNIKDSLQSILQNDTVETETRFNKAFFLVYFNSPPEEAEDLGMNVMYPFAKKMWNEPSEQLSRLARIYLMIGSCHRERGGADRDEKERQFIEQSVEEAVKSGNNVISARCWNALAYMELKRGDVARGHECMYQAMIYFDNAEMYVKSSEMLYVIASNFLNIKDTEGVKRVLQQMEDYLEKDNSKQSQYQYNIIKYTWLVQLLEKTDSEAIDRSTVDAVFVYIRKNIDLVENHLHELSPYWMHGYAYYFLAKELNAYYPDQLDSIFFYLDKAREMFDKEEYSRKNEANSAMEFHILTNIVRAKALSRQGKMQAAYKVMSEVLRLLDELKSYKNLDTHREWAYRFMVDYYEKTNNPAQALKYYKLLLESEAQRYESEKVQAMNSMSVKYETEKKEMQIQNLVKENRAAHRILWLAIALSLALLTAFVLIIWSNRLKRKNTEQQLYEMALLAELRQNELEQLQNTKQQLGQLPIQNAVENVAQAISDSTIYIDDKKIYLKRLTKLDVQMLENARQSSTAKITGMDMKYIICFAAEMNEKDISLLFNIEPASIYTVRYRIRKKFANEASFQVIF